MSQPRPKTRYARWIAAGLLLSLLILALRCALPIYRRKQAIWAIEQFGAGVATDWRRGVGPWPWWHRFVPWQIGPALANVTGVGLGRPQSTPQGTYDLDGQRQRARSRAAEWLPLVRAFPELTALYLDGADVHDKDLAVLSELLCLQRLNLSGTQVHGPGLEFLARSTRLKSLYLDGTAIDDEGLAYLSALPDLEVLSLDRTAITDAGLKHLATLPKLRELSVSNTQVTAEGVEELRRLNPRIEVSDD